MVSVPAPPPLACAVFLVIALGLAGVAHVLWLRSLWSKPFVQALDCGVQWRGRRLFGDNKTLRGLMMMPLATAAIFLLFGFLRDSLPLWLATGMWPVSYAQMAIAGFFCGLAFMLAELPNSFFKRQMGIAPGAAPDAPALRMLCFIIDRCDSTLGALFALSLILPMHPLTWVWALLLGIGLHWAFSAWLYRLKLKARPS